MLSYLAIRDFAIIRKLQVEFHDGFNVLTGETGAGKSILIQALHLLLAGAAAKDMIRTDKDSAEVEGVFQLSREHRILERLRKLDLADSEEPTTFAIRRVISRTGRNRVFINTRISTLAPGPLSALYSSTAARIPSSTSAARVPMSPP